MEFEELNNSQLLQVDGGGRWGLAYTVAGSAIGAGVEGAEIGSVLGPEGAAAGAIGCGLCGAAWGACEYYLTSAF